MENSTFSQKQIKQYAEIFTRWFRFDKHVIPARFDQKVLAHAQTWGFINHDGKHWRLTQNSHYDLRDLPVEVIWHFVKPLVLKHEGFSITRCRDWYDSWNLEKGNIAQIEEVLFKLDWAGFITFLSSGNVWRIYINDPR